MEFFDITRALSAETLVYPGDMQPSFRQRDEGKYLISDLQMSTHTGTHIDAPAHYLKSGETIDTIPLTRLIGRCRVVDVSRAGNTITADHLAGKTDNITRLLLKTSFSGQTRFAENYPSLSLDAALLITGKGICCIGIDSPSIESYHCDGTVHKELLGKGCIIIELLDLSAVPEGDYDMIALPLRLEGLDGSPARVVLMNTLQKEGICMDILIDSVNKLERILEHSGCEEVGVLLDVNPDTVNCQFDRGACMTASFGGRSAEFVTSDPIRAQTKISFMFGAPLDTPSVRSAACAMINVATGFFCLSRVLHACPSAKHADCMRELSLAIKGKRVMCIGSMPGIENAVPGLIVNDHKDADLVLINAEGMIDPELGNIIEEIGDTKRIICIGPSTAGVARLQQIEHWCPYGKSV